MKPSVFVHTWTPDDVLEDLRTKFEVDHHDHINNGGLPASEIHDRVRGKDGFMVLGARVDEELLQAAGESLKIVANCAVGVDDIDIAACTRAGVQVTNTPDVLTDAVADMAIGLMLAVGRRIVEADQYTRAGRFQGPPFGLFWGAEIRGETLGIVGMGRIGQATARRAKGFGLDIVYHNRNRLESAREAELGAAWLSLEDLLARARYVILLTPLTDQTHHLIDARRLSQMRPDGYLINVSRGPVVHERALLEALQAGTIAGAALDVYEFEPKMTDGLAALSNTVLTPHIASANVATRHGMIALAAKNLSAVLAGEAPLTPVNRLDGSG